MEVDPPSTTSSATLGATTHLHNVHSTPSLGSITHDDHLNSIPSTSQGSGTSCGGVSHPTLKRSNSAPMINILTSVCPPGSPLPHTRHHHEHDGHCLGGTSNSNSSSGYTSAGSSGSSSHLSQGGSLVKEGARIRRFSASYASVDLHSPTAALKTPYRLDQLKHEERIHIVEREAAHEREVQTTMQMSMSWDDLTLQDEVPAPKRPGSFSEPLHIFTSPYPISSSPSPTRAPTKQCFSPSLQAAVKVSSVQARKTPSPTRKTFARRSGSPVTLRPSPLSIKRKLTGDYEDPESYLSPPKRFHPIQSSSMSDRLSTVINHPLIHCISSSSPSDSGSPEQQVPNLSLSSSAGSPAPPTSSLGNTLGLPSAFSFRTVRPLGSHPNHSSDPPRDIREPCDMAVGNTEETGSGDHHHQQHQDHQDHTRVQNHGGSVSMDSQNHGISMDSSSLSSGGNHGGVSMDSSPSGSSGSTSFNSATGRPTQV